MGTTRAGQLVEPGRMVFVEAPVEPLRDGDLLVRSRYASICGSDLHVVNHGVDDRADLWAPGYPGHEGVGEVAESRAAGFAPGRPGAAWCRRCRKPAASPSTSACAPRSVVKLDGPLPPIEQLLMAQQLGTVVYRRPPASLGRGRPDGRRHRPGLGRDCSGPGR